MRNRVSGMIALLGLLTCPVVLRGQNPVSAPSPGKIAALNFQEAIANTAEGKKAISDLQKKYQPRQQELQRQQQEIGALQDQLQKQATTLSDEERLRLTRELDDKQKLFKRSQEDATADFQADQQDMLRRLGQKMGRVINDYAQQNGCALVVDYAQIPIYYVAKDIDITEEIVKRFDAANPVDKPETPAASSPTAPPPRAPAPVLKPPPTAKPPVKPKP